MASFLNASNGIVVYVTTDGGTTWTPRTGFSTITWAALTSLNCAGRKCLGLAKLSFGWRVERTNNFGKTWKKVTSLRGSILTLACASLATVRRGRHDGLVRAVAGHVDVGIAQGGQAAVRAVTDCRRRVRIEDL